MRKNLLLMLCLSAIVLLAGCGKDNPIESPEEISNQSETNTDTVDQDHSDGAKTSLTVADLERIEETLLPLSYDYETYDMEAQAVVNSGSYKVTEGEEPVLSVLEYKNMVSREVTSSGIEDDMIYTLTNITLEDGNVLHVLYVNEPDTLFYRAISIQNENLTTLYSNFVYAADLQ